MCCVRWVLLLFFFGPGRREGEGKGREGEHLEERADDDGAVM